MRQPKFVKCQCLVATLWFDNLWCCIKPRVPQSPVCKVAAHGVKQGIWRHKLQYPHSDLIHKLTPRAWHSTSTLRWESHMSYIIMWTRMKRHKKDRRGHTQTERCTKTPWLLLWWTLDCCGGVSGLFQIREVSRESSANSRVKDISLRGSSHAP